ncbi:MAG: hypothetical protein QXS41_01035 [Candidatus Woesearchaeota archaeon]
MEHHNNNQKLNKFFIILFLFIFTFISTFAAEITQKLSDIWFNDIFFARMYFVMIIYILIDVAVENINLFQDNKHLARALALAMALLIQYMIPDSLFESVMRSGLAGFGALLLITLLIAILLLRSFGMQDSPIAKYLLIALLVLMLLILVLLFFPNIFGLSRGYGISRTSNSAMWIFLIVTIVYIFAILFVASYSDRTTPLVASLIIVFLFISYIQIKNGIFNGYNLDSFSNFLYWTAIAITLIVWFYIWRNFVPTIQTSRILRDPRKHSNDEDDDKKNKKRNISIRDILKLIGNGLLNSLLYSGYALAYIFRFLRRFYNLFRTGAYLRWSHLPIAEIVQNYTNHLYRNIDAQILNQVSCLNRERIRFRVRRSRLSLFQSFVVLLWDYSPNDREMYFYSFDKNLHIDQTRSDAQYIYYEIPLDRLIDYQHNRSFLGANFEHYQYIIISSNESSQNLTNLYQQLLANNHNYRVATNLFFYNVWNGFINSLNVVDNVENINVNNAPSTNRIFSSFQSFLAALRYRATGNLPNIPFVYRSQIYHFQYNPNVVNFRIIDPTNNANVSPLVSLTLESSNENLNDLAIFVAFIPRQQNNSAYLLYCGNSEVNPLSMYYINPNNSHLAYVYPFSFLRNINNQPTILHDGDYAVSVIGIRLCGNNNFRNEIINFISNNIVNNHNFNPLASYLANDNILIRFDVQNQGANVSQRVGQAFRSIINYLNQNNYRYFIANPITIHVQHNRNNLFRTINNVQQIQNILNNRRNQVNQLLQNFRQQHQNFFQNNPQAFQQIQNILNEFFQQLEEFVTTPNLTMIQYLWHIIHRRDYAIVQLMNLRTQISGLLTDHFSAVIILISQEISSDILNL